jgi:hypothetical protein
MAPKRKARTKKKSGAINWSFPTWIPTYDFPEVRLAHRSHVDLSINEFIYLLESGYYHSWEAIIREEQGLTLNARQKEALGKLISFDEDPGDDIYYIDGLARPSRPWYESFRRIAPQILEDPFRTSKIHYAGTCEIWEELAECVDEFADSLSLPEGAASPLEVIPAEMRHRLWLQSCFTWLEGLGQEEEINLDDQPYRIDSFIEDVRRHKDSVKALGLNLDRLLTIVILPARDKPLFVAAMKQKLGLKSTRTRLAAHL